MQLINPTFLANLSHPPVQIQPEIEVYNDPVVAGVSISFLKFSA
jgi:hypothetical protein